MPKYIVIVMGLLLAVIGGAAIAFGYPIIEVERGWANVIAGAAILSGGVITISIGVLIGAVQRLRFVAAPGGASAPIERVAPLSRSDPATVPDVSPDARSALPEPTRPDEIIATTKAPVATTVRRPAFMPTRSFRPAEPPMPPAVPVEDAPSRPGAWIDEALAEKSAVPEAEGVVLTDEPRTSDVDGAHQHLDPIEASALPPVVGRYSFGGAKYVLYEDGSIDAETPNGIVRFTSLAELRTHFASAAPGSP
jgi:hypothetical protein